jgi:hypothetical protein
MTTIMGIHPLADLFPMMTDDELAELADDICTNGLIHPIVVDADGVLIDGRNRLRACEIAGIEPQFVALNGHDPAAFIVSANLERRNLSKGQQAIALAMIYPEPTRGRGHKDAARKVLETRGFSRQRLEQARTVVRHSRAYAEDVLADRMKLDVALRKVEEERLASQSIDVKMAELRAAAPDVAALVDDERITLEAGIAELRQRQRRTEEAIDAGKRAAGKIADLPVQLALLEQGIASGARGLLADIDAAEMATVTRRLVELLEDAP